MVILKSVELRQPPACGVDEELYCLHVVRHLDDVMGAPIELDICLDRARGLVPDEPAEIQLWVEESELAPDCPNALGDERAIRARAGRVEDGVVSGLVAGCSVEDIPIGDLPSERIEDLTLPVEACSVILDVVQKRKSERARLLPKGTKARLETAAVERGVTVSTFLRIAVLDRLRNAQKAPELGR